MSQTMTTVLVEHDSKSGRGKKGPWVLNLFTTEDGETLQTFDRKIANQAMDLLDQPVEVEYEIEVNGDYENFVIQSIEEAGSGGGSKRSSSRTSSSRSTSRTSGRGGSDPERQKVINRSAGLARAIEAFAVANEDPISNETALFELALAYATFIETGEVPE